jgi:hypothetical protein
MEEKRESSKTLEVEAGWTVVWLIPTAVRMGWL